MHKVAFIDTGIQGVVRRYEGYSIIKKRFCKKESKQVLINHGKRCAEIFFTYRLHKVKKKAKFYDIQVLNGLSGDAYSMLLALKWCARKKVDVISISCGTNDMFLEGDFVKIINILFERGTVIIAAGSNNSNCSIPAELEKVIGVKTKFYLNKDQFYTTSMDVFQKGINIIAPSEHIIKTVEGDTEQTPLCNSYAAPYVTALICNYLDAYPRNSCINKLEYIQYRLNEDSRNINGLIRMKGGKL